MLASSMGDSATASFISLLGGPVPGISFLGRPSSAVQLLGRPSSAIQLLGGPETRDTAETVLRTGCATPISPYATVRACASGGSSSSFFPTGSTGSPGGLPVGPTAGAGAGAFGTDPATGGGAGGAIDQLKQKILSIDTEQPWYKKWQTYAIGGGAVVGIGALILLLK